jgi:hypothetical protein
LSRRTAALGDAIRWCSRPNAASRLRRKRLINDRRKAVARRSVTHVSRRFRHVCSGPLTRQLNCSMTAASLCRQNGGSPGRVADGFRRADVPPSVSRRTASYRQLWISLKTEQRQSAHMAADPVVPGGRNAHHSTLRPLNSGEIRHRLGSANAFRPRVSSSAPSTVPYQPRQTRSQKPS